MPVNEYNQPIGISLPDWKPAAMPVPHTLTGRFCRLLPLDAEKHAEGLFAAHQLAADDRNWTYLPYDRPDTLKAMRAFLEGLTGSEGFVHFAVLDSQSGKPVGSVALMRIDPASGVLEIGHVNFSPRMQRTSASTEVIFLLLSYAFDALGYRRCEWKCDGLNAPSRAAAMRFGFVYEGTFKNAIVTKGRNRDTDWFTITDQRWPHIRAAFMAWLDAGNFDSDGRQIRRLGDFFPPETP
ncbi:GNAT family N-acetyltransferase [Oxalobacter vibrioformis]|uniref:GNAT family N-acetyltransferase n=1 Tax=Oxalobacter vibrioformis TaxID=933080 RepID=A0A9E9LZ97_9BURK|nr:GNAT family protein [Oxalobacter vibrioformis]WAW10297.1 GNAT family N-acetyltransferase [Oxalobacter vibrioformis]